MKYLALVGILALALGGQIGCASERNTVTDEDRVVVHYNGEAWGLVAQLLPTLGVNPVAATAALAQIVNGYGVPLSARMLKAWGPPKEPPAPISEEAVKNAIAASEKSHAVPWWQSALAGALSAAGVMLTLGKVAARFIPGVGQFVTLAESAFAGVERFIQDRKAAGDVAAVDRLVTFLRSEQADPRLRSLVESTLHRVKKRLGVDGTENLDIPAAPAPSPTPAPVA
jgi:hypothetical protein